MFSFFKKKNKLMELLPKVRGIYKPNEKLAKYTWFGVGGPAEVMFCPEDNNDLGTFMKLNLITYQFLSLEVDLICLLEMEEFQE